MTAAVLFQNMPPLSREEYEALETSIREHGIQVPVVVDENRVVIDGHHRQKIAQELGIECPKRVVFDKTDAEKRTLALSLNLDRRHLNREQRRALIAESIKADPELSDREHGRRTGASKNTAAAVRAELVERGQVDHVSERTDSLGRQQPASKPRPEPEIDLANVDMATGEILSEGPVGEFVSPYTDIAEAAKKKVTGLDGKEYSRPEPQKPRRKPLTDAARDAGWELRKAVERLQRIAEDDRFSRNKEEVTPHLRGHLINAVEVCQDLLDQINPEGN